MNLSKYSILYCKTILGLKVAYAVALNAKNCCKYKNWQNVPKMLYNANANAEAKADDWG